MIKYLYLITAFIYLSISVSPIMAIESGAKTQVKAEIPAKTYIRIFGYTAPSAIVQAEAIRVFAQTSSDKTGYFQINELPISAEAKELCLTTIDSARRTGFPLCIYIPETDKPSEIGPLLLSPTISFSMPLIWQNQIAYLSGQTIPDSQVKVAFFEVESSTLAQKFYRRLAKMFFPKTYAFDLPPLLLQSDKEGFYSVNLPSYKAVGYRVFSKAIYNEMHTPKSQTLAFAIGAITRYFSLYILPWILLIIFLLITSAFALAYEVKTKKGRKLILRFKEKRLKPFAVRTLLSLRRLWYNLQDWWRSHRK